MPHPAKLLLFYLLTDQSLFVFYKGTVAVWNSSEWREVRDFMREQEGLLMDFSQRSVIEIENGRKDQIFRSEDISSEELSGKPFNNFL